MSRRSRTSTSATRPPSPTSCSSSSWWSPRSSSGSAGGSPITGHERADARGGPQALALAPVQPVALRAAAGQPDPDLPVLLDAGDVAGDAGRGAALPADS